MARGRPLVVLLTATALAAGVLLWGMGPDDLGAWWEGERTWAGERLLEVPEMEADARDGIDFSALHAELWPSWVASEAEQRDAATQALLTAVQFDVFLTQRIERIVELSHKPGRNAQRLLDQVWAYNQYLDQSGIPWRLSAGVQLHGVDHATFFVKSYQVVSDTRTRVGDDYWRTRVVQRVDDLGIVEGYLGMTSDHEDGAVVVSERVADFALERIWPLLDPELDQRRHPNDQRFAASVREVAASNLEPEHFEVLARTAEGRFWLEYTLSQVHRRAACGSRFQISMLPFDGLGPDDLNTLRRYAAATAHQPCPDVTFEEAVTISLFSKELRKEPQLRESLEALTAWVARSIAVHEARHVADDAAGRVVTCEGCPEEFNSVARLEVSAYLATFAHEESAVVAMVQACAVAEVDAHGRGAAIQFIGERLGRPCESGIPQDMVTRARAMQMELFGHAEPIVLSPSFPTRLPLERALP